MSSKLSGDLLISEAVKALKRVYGSELKAQAKLAEASRDGTLRFTYDSGVLEVIWGPIGKPVSATVRGLGTLKVLGPGVIGPTSWLLDNNTDFGSKFWYWNESIVSWRSGPESLSISSDKANYSLKGERCVLCDVKVYFDELKDLIAHLNPKFLLVLTGANPSKSNKWDEIKDLQNTADTGQLGNLFGSPSVRGFETLIRTEIRSRYPDDADWPSDGTIRRKASQLVKDNRLALERFTSTKVNQTEP